MKGASETVIVCEDCWGIVARFPAPPGADRRPAMSRTIVECSHGKEKDTMPRPRDEALDSAAFRVYNGEDIVVVSDETGIERARISTTVRAFRNGLRKLPHQDRYTNGDTPDPASWQPTTPAGDYGQADDDRAGHPLSPSWEELAHGWEEKANEALQRVTELEHAHEIAVRLSTEKAEEIEELQKDAKAIAERGRAEVFDYLRGAGSSAGFALDDADPIETVRDLLAQLSAWRALFARIDELPWPGDSPRAKDLVDSFDRLLKIEADQKTCRSLLDEIAMMFGSSALTLDEIRDAVMGAIQAATTQVEYVSDQPPPTLADRYVNLLLDALRDAITSTDGEPVDVLWTTFNAIADRVERVLGVRREASA